MESENVIDAIRRHLDLTSVRGEHLETPEEKARLDAIGEPANRHLDLVVFRLLHLASCVVGVGGLTGDEMDTLRPLMEIRIGIAAGMETGEIVERQDADGAFRYFPGPHALQAEGEA